jgi:hypothetical protein
MSLIRLWHDQAGPEDSGPFHFRRQLILFSSIDIALQKENMVFEKSGNPV